MITVCLVSFYTRLDEYPNKYSLSSMRLGGYIIKHKLDIKVRIVAFALNDSNEKIIEKILNLSPDILTLPGYIWTKDKSHCISNLIHQKSPKTLIVYGGPETISMDIKAWSDQDLFIIGQGEEPLLWICQQRLKKKSFKANDLSTSVPYAIYSKGLDRRLVMDKIIVDRENKTLPQGEPIYSDEFMSIFGSEKPGNQFSWFETARGCIYSCSFCGHNTLPFFATFNLNYVKQEIINLNSLRMKEVFIVDPILGGKPERGKEILRLFIKYSPNIAIRAYMRPEFLDEEFIALLAKSNIKELLIGIQTINPNVPRHVRSNNFYKINKYLPKLSESKVPWRTELITGLPGDTMGGLRESLKFAINELYPESIYTYHLTAIPDTKLYEMINKTEDEYWLNIDPKSQRVLSSNSFSVEEMNKMLIYSGASTSLYSLLLSNSKYYFKSQKPSFNYIDSLVVNYLKKAPIEHLLIFKNQNRSKAIEIWQEILYPCKQEINLGSC